MKKLNGTETKALFILSIVVPVGLLTTFRLTGVLHEPPTPETVTIDEVMWEMERPSKYTRIAENVGNAYSDDAISINASVSIHSYFENGQADPYWDRDGIAFRVNINATTFEGSLASLGVEFHPDVNSTIYINPTFSKQYNATVTRIKGIGTNTGVSYFEAKVSGSPCSLKMPSHWVFTDQNLENHQLRVNVEVTYFNRTTYRTIIAPITLQVLIAPTQGLEE